MVRGDPEEAAEALQAEVHGAGVGSNMFRQTVATMIGGMTTGRMKSAR